MEDSYGGIPVYGGFLWRIPMREFPSMGDSWRIPMGDSCREFLWGIPVYGGFLWRIPMGEFPSMGDSCK